MFGGVIVVRGTGSAGQRHLRALRTHLGLRPVAYPARSDRDTTLRADGITTISGLEELGAGKACAIVATNTGRHVADTRELLRIGDVLVEKPLAPTLEGLPELERLAASLGRRIWVAFCLRFEPSLRRFGELLPSIGCVDAVRIECQSYLPDWRPGDHRATYSARPDEGGVLRDLSHEIDYAVHFFGRPQAVFAVVTRSGRLGIEAEDAADLTWSVASTVVSLRLDYLSPVARRRMRASGADGELEWDGIAQHVRLRRGGSDEMVESFPCTRDELFARQAAAFLDACDGGDAGPLATFQEGAFVAALTDAAHRSAASGAAQPVASMTP